MKEIIFDLLCVGKPAKAFSLNPEVRVQMFMSLYGVFKVNFLTNRDSKLCMMDFRFKHLY